MKVFWSWQNDADPKRHRHFIKAALEEAIEAVALDLGVEDADRPEIDHATKGVRGAVQIANEIMRKIADSAAFVADVTPIAKTAEGKALPNPNVMIELGWAFNRPGFERHIYVMNTADGFGPDDLPFDIRDRLVMPYRLAQEADKKTKDGVRKTLANELAYALRTNLENHLDEVAEKAEIARVQAKPDDPSIWSTATDVIAHQDSLGRDHQDQVRLIDGPRAYIRVSPAGWKAGSPPPVGNIERYDSNFSVQPYAVGVSSGSFGATEEGFVRYLIKGHDETEDVVMYFDETGEFWVVQGSAISRGKSGKNLELATLFKGWSSALRRSNFLMDYFKASPVRRVEVGIVGLKDARWPGNFEAERKPARKDNFVYDAVDRNWSHDRQCEFLIEAYTRLTNVFGWPKPSRDEATRIVDATDIDRPLSPPWLRS